MLIVQPLFIGTTEIILIGVAALLIFGGKKLPEMMRGLGKGVKEFRSGMSDDSNPDGGAQNKEAGHDDKAADANAGNGKSPEGQHPEQIAQEKDSGQTV